MHLYVALLTQIIRNNSDASLHISLIGVNVNLSSLRCFVRSGDAGEIFTSLNEG